MEKLPNDVSNFLSYCFLLVTFLSRKKSNTRPYLLASSMATATATIMMPITSAHRQHSANSCGLY